LLANGRLRFWEVEVQGLRVDDGQSFHNPVR